MKKLRLFLLMLSAAVLPFTACQTGEEAVDGNGDGSNNEGGGVVEVVTPTVEVTLVEGSVTANGFVATVVTTNAEAAAWKVLAHGEAAPEAAVVLDEGASLALPENGPATVVVEYLNPETEYCLYVAVKAGEQYALSAPLCVTTLAETPDTPVDPGTPAVPVVYFYADASMGYGRAESQNLAQLNGMPGHMLYLTALDWSEEQGDFVMTGMASLVLLDYDFQQYNCTNYVFLTEHDYPMIAGLEGQTSRLVVDGTMTNFYINGVSYYPVVPETAADADGYPYGVSVLANPNTQNGVDMNYLLFNIPAQDEAGNNVVIQGSYTGPLGYDLSAGGTTPTYPFVMNGSQGYGFEEFAATKDGDKLTLKSSNHNGDLVFVLDLAQNNGEVEGTWMALEDGSGSLTGYFFDPYEGGGDFVITSGQFALEATETPGQYTLIPSSRNPVKFVGPHTKELSSDVDYTITVTGL